MLHSATRVARTAFGVCTIALALSTAPPCRPRRPIPLPRPTTTWRRSGRRRKWRSWCSTRRVTPRWLENERSLLVRLPDARGTPVLRSSIRSRRSKAPLFDHAKMAATLTSITRIPYDAQHLPFTTVRFVKNDTAFEFDVQVPADASIATPPKRETTTEQGAAAQAPERPARQPDERQTSRSSAAGGGGRRATPPRAAQPDAALRVRPRHRAGHAPRGLQGRAAAAALGVAVARRQDRRVRAQKQPLHDGRRQLREGAEEGRRPDHRRRRS